MIYAHWREFDGEWEWPNFTAEELSCKCCGEYYHDSDSLDYLQESREILGVPFKINSAHRCVDHNARVGGAPQSQHLKIAFDIRKGELDPEELYDHFDKEYEDFAGVGIYSWGVHVDFRDKKARW